MSKIYYELGLTDEDHDSFYHANVSTDKSTHYNLRRQEPSIEKATLTWEFKDTPVVRSILDAWETIIRAPHLLMNHVDRSDTNMSPGLCDHRIRWEYIALVPLPDLEYYELTIEDAELLETNAYNQFGSLYLNYGLSTARHTVEYQQGWRWAVDNQQVSNLAAGPVKMLALPAFEANFILREQRPPMFAQDDGIKLWMKTKKTELDALGYYPQDPRCKLGSYRLAELVTDPVETVNILEKYKNPCRHSIVTEEVMKDRKKNDN